MTNPSTVTVFTKPNCSECVKVKTFLKNDDVAFTEKPIDNDVLTMARELGILTAPIVTFKNDHYPETVVMGGFDEEFLEEISIRWHMGDSKE